jgi:hypothetical protein
VHDPVAIGFRTDERQSDSGLALGEQSETDAERNWIHEQVQFVNETVGDQRPHERGAPADLDA